MEKQKINPDITEIWKAFVKLEEVYNENLESMDLHLNNLNDRLEKLEVKK